MTTDLHQILDAIADGVTRNPAAATATFRADSELVGVCEVAVRVGDHTIAVDEPPALGGGGVAPNPVEQVLAALGSCQAITYRFWSTKLDIPLDKVTVDVTGELDVRGVFGLEDDVRPGYQGIRYAVTLDGPASDAQYEALREAVDRHCPVLDIIANPTPVRAEVSTDVSTGGAR